MTPPVRVPTPGSERDPERVQEVVPLHGRRVSQLVSQLDLGDVPPSVPRPGWDGHTHTKGVSVPTTRPVAVTSYERVDDITVTEPGIDDQYPPGALDLDPDPAPVVRALHEFESSEEPHTEPPQYPPNAYEHRRLPDGLAFQGRCTGPGHRPLIELPTGRWLCGWCCTEARSSSAVRL